MSVPIVVAAETLFTDKTKTNIIQNVLRLNIGIIMVDTHSIMGHSTLSSNDVERAAVVTSTTAISYKLSLSP
jgi:hypothetical protein